MNQFSIRTDLAVEAMNEKDKGNRKNFIKDTTTYKNIVVEEVRVDERISEEIGKKVGIYYSLDLSECDINDTDCINTCIDCLSKVIKKALKNENIMPHHKGLIVGLGNINVTPDSLGPLVIDNVIVTRHMFLIDPENISEGISNICALSPGVMGNTGIETTDIVDAVIKKIDVDYVIVVDALAASSINRVNKSIQITNTGISPGSGVGNKRKEISKDTLNIPVIAIGVPTVVDAVTIASNTMDYLLKYLNRQLKNKNVEDDVINFDKEKLPSKEYQKHFLGSFGILTEEEKIEMFNSVLSPNGLNMMVTPKEVDIDIENLSQIISSGLDKAIHTIIS